MSRARVTHRSCQQYPCFLTLDVTILVASWYLTSQSGLPHWPHAFTNVTCYKYLTCGWDSHRLVLDYTHQLVPSLIMGGLRSTGIQTQ